MKKTNSRPIGTLLILVISILFISALVLDTESPPVLKHKYQWWLEDINWSEHCIRSNTGKAPVKIAVIDTGIDGTHPDLVGAIADEFFVGVETEERVDDFEHGTSIAGIIAGKPASKDGIQGIAPNSLIYSIDVSDGNNDINVHDLVSAIEKAIKLNVDIINISMGTIQDFPALQIAVEKAYENGIVVVAAMGNDTSKSTLYPAMYDEVLAVGSLNKQHDELYGQPFREGVVYLPGENILTTYSSQTSEKKTISQSGTSLSAPILTGIIALIMQKDPSITAEEIYGYFLAADGHYWDVKEVLEDF